MVKHTSSIRIRYADTDQMKYAYYGKFFEYFEQGRSDLLRSIGLPYSRVEEMGLFLPVIEAHASYKKAARYDDLLAIEVWPALIERVRLNFAHRILNQDGKLILEAETFHVCAGVNEKPKRLPEELAAQLAPYLNRR